MRGDVTAVVLTLGEPSTEKALRSVERQTLQPADTVVVRGVSPFFQALSNGIAEVRTPFFVQVDADMVLDDTCIERLRAAMTPEVGIAVGQLRDPLVGTISGIKLFRRVCFDATPLRDSSTQDVDFYLEIGGKGWLTLHVLDYAADAGLHTFGEHLPDLTPSYAYATYYQLGCRYHRRRDPEGFLWRFDRLRQSDHPMARVARFALCAGIFSDEARDVGKASIEADPLLLDCLAGPRRPLEACELPAEPTDCFSLGASLRATDGYAALCEVLDRSAALPGSEGWIAEAALCHGFSAAGSSAAETETRLRALEGRRFVSLAL